MDGTQRMDRRWKKMFRSATFIDVEGKFDSPYPCVRGLRDFKAFPSGSDPINPKFLHCGLLVVSTRRRDGAGLSIA